MSHSFSFKPTLFLEQSLAVVVTLPEVNFLSQLSQRRQPATRANTRADCLSVAKTLDVIARREMIQEPVNLESS